MMTLLVDGWHGQYVMETFIRNYNMSVWHCEDYAKEYLNADDEIRSWLYDDIINTAYYRDADGFRWYLHQDGDLFAYREDHEWED